MDIQTGKVYQNHDDGVEDLQSKGLIEDEIEKRLQPITEEVYTMNRHERRKAAKLARSKIKTKLLK